MCYFQQGNGSQKGYLGSVRGDGWRGFEGFSFSWLSADWIIHGHPTGSWAACETHFTRLRCLTAAMPSFHPRQNQSRWLLPLQNRHTVWWGKLCWLCFNRDEWEIPNTEVYLTGVWEVGGETEQSPIGNVAPVVFLTLEQASPSIKTMEMGAVKWTRSKTCTFLESNLKKAKQTSATYLVRESCK